MCDLVFIRLVPAVMVFLLHCEHSDVIGLLCEAPSRAKSEALAAKWHFCHWGPKGAFGVNTPQHVNDTRPDQECHGDLSLSFHRPVWRHKYHMLDAWTPCYRQCEGRRARNTVISAPFPWSALEFSESHWHVTTVVLSFWSLVSALSCRLTWLSAEPRSFSSTMQSRYSEAEQIPNNLKESKHVCHEARSDLQWLSKIQKQPTEISSWRIKTYISV